MERHIVLKHSNTSILNGKNYYYWLCHTTYGILVLGPGIEHRPSTVRVQGPNHWTTWEFPLFLRIIFKLSN